MPSNCRVCSKAFACSICFPVVSKHHLYRLLLDCFTFLCSWQTVQSKHLQADPVVGITACFRSEVKLE